MTAALITSPIHVVRVAPELTLTSDLYEAAAASVAEHTPHLGPLRWHDFIAARQWTLVPDELSGEAYKAEFTLSKTTGQTVKLNYWLLPDRRGGAEQAKPHNHPWDFRAIIIDGVLVEDRVQRVDGDLVYEPGVEHRVGDVNQVGRELFHEIVDVRPGSLTLMLCGPGMSGWGYLDADGNYTPATLPDGFAQRLRELNPHQQ
jgi:hypothetical protein